MEATIVAGSLFIITAEMFCSRNCRSARVETAQWPTSGINSLQITSAAMLSRGKCKRLLLTCSSSMVSHRSLYHTRTDNGSSLLCCARRLFNLMMVAERKMPHYEIIWNLISQGEINNCVCASLAAERINTKQTPHAKLKHVNFPKNRQQERVHPISTMPEIHLNL